MTRSRSSSLLSSVSAASPDPSTDSARARLRSSSWPTFCSMVPSVSSRWTWIGQTRPVQVHRMICRGTVEEKVAELLTRKRALADAVLGNGETALTELSNDELRDLVTLRRT